MAQVKRYEPCPRCRAAGRDSRGDNLVRYVDESAHCFACSYHVFPSVSRVIQRKSIETNATKATLPGDFSRHVPVTAWQWLLRFGLPWSHWQESVGYSETEERLIFTVGDPIQFSIGRYLGPEDKSKRKWYVWGDSHKHCEVINPGKESVVLVEDIISAHKVGNLTTAIPLFGTVIYPCHIWYLNTIDKPVKLWLDKDQEPVVWRKALQLGSLINRPVEIITTEEDPKSLSFDMIGKVI